LVLWFSRNSAHEIAGFLACVNRLGERPYAIIDATRDRPPAYVSIMPPYRLAELFGSKRVPTALEKTQFANIGGVSSVRMHRFESSHRKAWCRHRSTISTPFC